MLLFIVNHDERRLVLKIIFDSFFVLLLKKGNPDIDRPDLIQNRQQKIEIVVNYYKII